jgi:hypothetical protein
MGHDLIFYQFSRSKVERGDFLEAHEQRGLSREPTGKLCQLGIRKLQAAPAKLGLRLPTGSPSLKAPVTTRLAFGSPDGCRIAHPAVFQPEWPLRVRRIPGASLSSSPIWLPSI